MWYRTSVYGVLAAGAAAIVTAAVPSSPIPLMQGNPAAQTKGQSGNPPAARPALQVTTRLVQVSVVAHDGHGKPVEDLSREDFRLFDNGQEVKVEFFEKETVGVRSGAPETPAAAGTPPIWSNRQARAGMPINLTILLFDALNTKREDQSRARTEIIKFLGRLQPEDRIALYALGANIHVLHEFTSDTVSLLRVLGKYPGYNGADVVESHGALPDDLLAQNNEPLDFQTASEEVIQQAKTVDRVLRTTDAMEAIAAHVASLPGRKSLVWVSSSFPMLMGYERDLMDAESWGLDQRDFTEQVDRASRALNDANVAVYPVDPSALDINTRAQSQRPPTSTNMRIASRAPATLAPNIAGKQTMEEMAARTGGIAYYDTNDISGAIHSAMEDSRLVYTLAYTPEHGEWNDEFRKIKVEVKRSGVHLRYRSGYLATPFKPLDPAQKDHVLAEAQWSPIEAAEIGLKFQAQPAPVAGGKPGLRFLLVADPAGLRFVETEGTHAADLVLTLAQKAADGHLVFEETKTLNMRLKEDRYQAVMAQGLKLGGSQTVDPAATEFRVVLLDIATGRLGSVHVPMSKLGLSAPAAAAAPTAAPASDKPKP